MDKETCPCSYGICDECEADGKFEPENEDVQWKKNFFEKFQKTY